MSYIGSSAAPQFLSFSGVRSQSFNGDGTTTAFNLNRPVDNVTSVEVLVNNVQQSPFDSSYSVSGSTLTFSEAPSIGTSNIYVIFRDAPLGSLNPLDGSVTTDKIVNGAVTNAKLAADGFDAGKFTTGTLPIARVADGAVTAAKLASTLDLTGKTVTLPAGVGGKVLQVVQTVKTDSFAGSVGAQWGDVPGMSVAITPLTASSKILVMVDMKAAGDNGLSVCMTRLVRNSTPIYLGDFSSSRGQSSGAQAYYTSASDANLYIAQVGFTYLDSPATTSAITYKIQIGGDNNGSVLFVNRTEADRAGGYFDTRTASSITVMEIAA